MFDQEILGNLKDFIHFVEDTIKIINIINYHEFTMLKIKAKV